MLLLTTAALTVANLQMCRELRSAFRRASCCVDITNTVDLGRTLTCREVRVAFWEASCCDNMTNMVDLPPITIDDRRMEFTDGDTLHVTVQDGMYMVNNSLIRDGIALRVGASYRMRVPAQHPITFYSGSMTRMQVGERIEVRPDAPGVPMTIRLSDGGVVNDLFYSGDMTLFVHKESDERISLVCGNHGYMGAKDAINIGYGPEVFVDEFSMDGAVDTASWFHETVPPNNQTDGWWNGELQHYTDRLDNARVEAGHLLITARKEQYMDPTKGSYRSYTSARLLSRKLFDVGSLIEVRARMPNSVSGPWPAIWLLGTDGTDNSTMPYPFDWPRTGEIDIMEQDLGARDFISSAVHLIRDPGTSVANKLFENPISGNIQEMYTFNMALVTDELLARHDPNEGSETYWVFNANGDITNGIDVLMLQQSAPTRSVPEWNFPVNADDEIVGAWYMGPILSSGGWGNLNLVPTHIGIELRNSRKLDGAILYGLVNGRLWFPYSIIREMVDPHILVKANSHSLSDIQLNYHTYALAVDRAGRQLRFYVDQRLHWIVDDTSASVATSVWPFAEGRKLFLLLNVAMGGNLGGDVDSNFTEASMSVDWVRVHNI